MKWRVLITCPQFQKAIERYRDLFIKHGIDVELPAVVQRLSESEILLIIDRFDGVIAGDDEFTEKVLQKGKRLKVISKWGIGTDGIDREAAKKSGVLIFNTPNMFADEVADVVMGYIVMLARQLHKLDELVRRGQWPKIQGISLRGKTLGIIGVGSIGRAVAVRALTTGMRVMGYDVLSEDSLSKPTGLAFVKFDDLLKESDFISLNCNLTSSNYRMIGESQFSLMKDGVCLINTARGALVDEKALIRALQNNKVRGCALDVFEEEPLPLSSPLRQFENCVFGAHNSSNTREAVDRVNGEVVRHLLEGLGIELHHE